MRIGLDVGGTKTDAVAVTRDGDISGRVRLATGQGAEEVVETITAAINTLSVETGFSLDTVTSIGIGIPGQIETGTARVLNAVNLGVDSLDLAAGLAPRFAAPVAAENDVKAAALGAAALGNVLSSMAYLNLGTGVAAGIVLGGQLWRGSEGIAGEVGHLAVDPQGPLCRCGQRGCIEAFCGGAAVTRRWGRPGALPVRDVYDAADSGDAEAVVIRSDIARGVAAAVRTLVLTADVERVIFGGGLTALGDRLLEDVREALRRDAHGAAFIQSLRLDEKIDVVAPGSPVAAFGAALIGVAKAEEGAQIRG